VSDPTCLQTHTRVRDSSSGLCWSSPRRAGVLIQSSAWSLIDCIQQPSSQLSGQGGMLAGDLRRLPERRGRLRPDSGPRRKSCKKIQVIICVLLVELCERFTFFGIVCNTILFCTVKLGYDNYLAATVNLCFIGASTLTPVLVGWFAETCLGRSKVLYGCALLHFFGKTRLMVTACCLM